MEQKMIYNTNFVKFIFAAQKCFFSKNLRKREHFFTSLFLKIKYIFIKILKYNSEK